MIRSYTWSIEGEGYRFLVSLPKRQRKRVEGAIEELARHPFPQPLLVERDADGHALHVIETESFIITYHPDHAERRVRIVEISSLL